MLSSFDDLDLVALGPKISRLLCKGLDIKYFKSGSVLHCFSTSENVIKKKTHSFGYKDRLLVILANPCLRPPLKVLLFFFKVLLESYFNIYLFLRN